MAKPLFSFLNFNLFLGAFCNYSWNQHKILDFEKPNMTYFKKISPLRRAVFQIFGHNTSNKEEPLKIKINTFSTIVLVIFS